MNDLYPIIRRVRRPLVAPSAPPVSLARFEPPPVAPPLPVLETVVPVEPPKPSDEKTATKRNSR